VKHNKISVSTTSEQQVNTAPESHDTGLWCKVLLGAGLPIMVALMVTIFFFGGLREKIFGSDNTAKHPSSPHNEPIDRFAPISNVGDAPPKSTAPPAKPTSLDDGRKVVAALSTPKLTDSASKRDEQPQLQETVHTPTPPPPDSSPSIEEQFVEAVTKYMEIFSDVSESQIVDKSEGSSYQLQIAVGQNVGKYSFADNAETILQVVKALVSGSQMKSHHVLVLKQKSNKSDSIVSADTHYLAIVPRKALGMEQFIEYVEWLNSGYKLPSSMKTCSEPEGLLGGLW
jgi:hypothetical protein